MSLASAFEYRNWALEYFAETGDERHYLLAQKRIEHAAKQAQGDILTHIFDIYIWGTISELASPVIKYTPKAFQAVIGAISKLNDVKSFFEWLVFNKQQNALTKSFIIRSLDPNEKTGPEGIGANHYVVEDEHITYTIYFENKSSATAPAQEVFIDDYLDQNLDWTTFKMGEVAFEDKIVTSLEGKENGSTQVMLEELAVDIEVLRFPGTGHVRWTLRTIDPETGELPEDAFAGFLPPEDGNGSGQGHVTFTIRTKDSLPVETRIANSASIVFDTNEPIITNEVFNTITNDKPNAPDTPSTTDGATDVAVSTVLNWTPSDYATAYDLYIWQSDQSKPSVPTAADLETPFYDAAQDLEYGTTYYWQVVAKNVMGGSESPVWSFTTKPYTAYLMDAISILKIMTGITPDATPPAIKADDNDRLGLAEAIFLLRKAADN